MAEVTPNQSHRSAAFDFAVTLGEKWYAIPGVEAYIFPDPAFDFAVVPPKRPVEVDWRIGTYQGTGMRAVFAAGSVALMHSKAEVQVQLYDERGPTSITTFKEYGSRIHKRYHSLREVTPFGRHFNTKCLLDEHEETQFVSAIAHLPHSEADLLSLSRLSETERAMMLEKIHDVGKQASSGHLSKAVEF